MCPCQGAFPGLRAGHPSVHVAATPHRLMPACHWLWVYRVRNPYGPPITIHHDLAYLVLPPIRRLHHCAWLPLHFD